MSIATLIDRVAIRFGYAKIPTIPLPPADEPIKVQPPHLQTEASFNYDKTTNKQDWAFFYSAEDGFHYAIGRRDWMPLMMAGFIVGGSFDGMGLISASISERLWLPVDSPIHTSWLEANRQAIQRVEAIDVTESAHDDESVTEFAPEMFSHLRAAFVSLELRTMWRRYQPHQPEVVLISSHGYNLLHRLPLMHDARQAPKAAMNQLLDWTADWFEARGLSVNREEQLLNVPGYEPLFAIDSDPGAY